MGTVTVPELDFLLGTNQLTWSVCGRARSGELGEEKGGPASNADPNKSLGGCPTDLVVTVLAHSHGHESAINKGVEGLVLSARVGKTGRERGKKKHEILSSVGCCCLCGIGIRSSAKGDSQ